MNYAPIDKAILGQRCKVIREGGLALTHTLSSPNLSAPLMQVFRPQLFARRMPVTAHDFQAEIISTPRWAWCLRAIPFSPFNRWDRQVVDSNGTILAEASPQRFRPEIIKVHEREYCYSGGGFGLTISDDCGIVLSGHSNMRTITVERIVQNIQCLLAYMLQDIGEDPGM
jgi:hypothetical protein